jgi:hypothetical protein
MILEALELVMRNNIFQFDNTFWMQLTGTAMGTSVACVYAAIYYSYHKETKLLRAFKHNSQAPMTLMPVPLMPVPKSNGALFLHLRAFKHNSRAPHDPDASALDASA